MKSVFERGLTTVTEYFLNDKGERIGERSRNLGTDEDIRDMDIIWYNEKLEQKEQKKDFGTRGFRNDRRKSK